jgi:hypothetical protein
MNTITIIEKEVNPVVKTAEALVIKDAQGMSNAVELLSQVNKNLDRVGAEEDKVVKPLKEALKAEQARWKPIKTALEAARDALRSTMSKWQTEQNRIKAEAEAKLAARVEKGTMKLETAVRKVAEIDTPAQSVATDAGMVKFRTVAELLIDNADLIPRKYLVVDEAAVKAALKAGIKVPGAVLVDEQVPVNYR